MLSMKSLLLGVIYFAVKGLCYSGQSQSSLHISATDQSRIIFLPTTAPTNSHEGSYTSLDDVCEQVEFSVWRTTEKMCGQINVGTSLSNWHMPAFSLYQNIRTYRSYNNTLLVAFDIVGPVGSFGNWWRVMISGESLSASNHVIHTVGRVIDNWNGNYTVYFALPSPGRYHMHTLLEYIACEGYPNDMISRNVTGFRYIGNFTSSTWQWKEHTDQYTAKQPVSDVVRYLADTGYYDGYVWVPSVMTYACNPISSKIPSNVTNMVIAGDSTATQLLKCVERGGCMKVLKENHLVDEALAAVGDSIHASPFLLYYKDKIDTQLLFSMIEKRSEPIVLLVNGGLHFVGHLPWKVQKQTVDDIVQSLLSHTAIVHPHEPASIQAEKNRDIYFVWRDTWSIHEYCFIPNIFWQTTATPRIAAYFLGKKTGHDDNNLHLMLLREPAVHIQRSYALDKIVRGSKRAFWMPSEFLSRAAIKETSNTDMIHHGGRVLPALWKELLNLYDA